MDVANKALRAPGNENGGGGGGGKIILIIQAEKIPNSNSILVDDRKP